MRSATIRIVLSLLAATVLTARPAAAQPIFFDDFNGPTLDPRWQFFSTPFDYTLAGGRLTVTRLNGRYPEPPPHGPDTSYGSFGIDLPVLNDFRVTIDLGWAPGSGRRLQLLASPAATLQMSELVGHAGLHFSGGGFVGSRPTPPPGPHRFTIIREAGRFRWLFDGIELAQAPDRSGSPVTRLYLLFDGPWSGAPEPMWLDSVLVVPAPGAAGLLVLALGALKPRRR
ncbi:MAG: hypothetical protein FJ255_01140 [Phycisphaerae bacterium]|nr:hypothetical protein [Phycisphaerae bacterium]